MTAPVDEGVPTSVGSRVDRMLGHPGAFVATAVLLLLVFGWTFVDNPDRPAPADDPAYYTWRTEGLLTEDPDVLLQLDGPNGMLAGGYRVATPVLAALMRRIMGVGVLAPTSLLAVGLRVAIPVLLAAFAYRYRRDAFVWHGVALGSASMLLTPPFGGYLDNLLTLFFVTAALFLLIPARSSWAARTGIVVLLVAAGLTHPTTLAIFGLVLGAMAGFRWLARGFDVRSVVRDDGPALAAALVAAVATYAIWKIGLWGEPAPLAEAAVPPPADEQFFTTRLSGWVRALRPLLNGPLFALAATLLLAAGRRAAEDELARAAIVWLAPLAGTFGFLIGLSYPFYRFFNTTLAWVLLIGLGAGSAVRFFVDIARRGGVGYLALAGVVAIGFIVATNFSTSFERSQWNNPADAWIKPDQRRELEALRSRLEGQARRPVVFVTDTDAPEAVRVFGWLKLVANVSRYGLAEGQQDRSAPYLGTAQNVLAGEPTDGEPANYRPLSQASLADVRAAIRRGSGAPVFVVARAFNPTNFDEQSAAVTRRGVELWIVDGNDVRRVERGVSERIPASVAVTGGVSGWRHLLAAIAGLVLLLVPGLLVWRRLVPDGSFPDGLALVPAFSAGLLSVVGVLVIAATGSALSATVAWITLAAAAALAAAPGMLARREVRTATSR